MVTEREGRKKLALAGGGPAALFLFKRLLESGDPNWEVHIYERGDRLGQGMPYGPDGACDEHVTNVSDTELPALVTSIGEWIENAPHDLKERYGIHAGNFNEWKVLPRLLFGRYLSDQFGLLLAQAEAAGLATTVYLHTEVTDLVPEGAGIVVVTAAGQRRYDAAVICTGHQWPHYQEDRFPEYFDSPYPPRKLAKKFPHAIAVRGSSLTAFDALRTLSRANGTYKKGEDGLLQYEVHPDCSGFGLVMHSLHGLLPAIRIHLDDPQLERGTILDEEKILQNKKENDGFVSLDFIFEKSFKEPFQEKDPKFYERIKDMDLETFVASMMELRERLDPFTLFKSEYAEAAKSIRRQQPVHWKELLAVLSYAVNYPAKHLSAEDMLRLRKVLMPLISIVIAFVPQSSAQELLALQEAGVLQLVAVDRDSEVVPQQDGGILYRYQDEEGTQQEVRYRMFVDCIGQPPLSFKEIPFPTLASSGALSPASLPFKDAAEGRRMQEAGHPGITRDAAAQYHLALPGITINDYFQVLDGYGAYNPRLYVMAVPYIGGLNPDYSGLDFCAAASEKIVAALQAEQEMVG